MAKMKGVFSNISGRVGTVTFSSTRNGQIMKTPSIPRPGASTLQNIRRRDFYRLINFAKYLMLPVIIPHWSYITPKHKKAWNFFFKTNYPRIELSFNPGLFLYSIGYLEQIRNANFSFNPSTFAFTLTWDSTCFFSGSQTDMVSIIIWRGNHQFPCFVSVNSVPRSAENLSGLINPVFDTGNFYVAYFVTNTTTKTSRRNYCSQSNMITVV
jgi:hypothetical protein